MKGMAISLRERKIIINIFISFKTENPSLKRNALFELTVKATGASAISVKRIVVEEDGNKSPGLASLSLSDFFKVIFRIVLWL